jgi:hypothetical protein
MPLIRAAAPSPFARQQRRTTASLHSANGATDQRVASAGALAKPIR